MDTGSVILDLIRDRLDEFGLLTAPSNLG